MFTSECSTPDTPDNGDVIVNGNVAQYTCKVGYTLNGLRERFCLYDGSGWNGTEPTCGRYSCGQLYTYLTTRSKLLTTLKKKAFENILGKGEKCWLPAFSPFPTMFSTCPKTNYNFLVTFFFFLAHLSTKCSE